MESFKKKRDTLKNGECSFAFVDATQLVKHAFGLPTQAHKRGKAAKLVYLYAEPKAYHDGKSISDHDIVAHREEVQRFERDVAMSKCDVEFSSLSYHDLFKTWAMSVDENVRIHAAAISQRFAI